MCGSNQPDIYTMCPATSQTFELLFWVHPQQFRLQWQWDISYLIEEQCSLVGHFETPTFSRDRSSESTLFVPKQFAFQ